MTGAAGSKWKAAAGVGRLGGQAAAGGGSSGAKNDKETQIGFFFNSHGLAGGKKVLREILPAASLRVKCWRTCFLMYMFHRLLAQ